MQVSQTGLNNVLRSEAYILFYTQVPAASAHPATPHKSTPTAADSKLSSDPSPKPTDKIQSSQPRPGLLLNGDSAKLKGKQSVVSLLNNLLEVLIAS